MVKLISVCYIIAVTITRIFEQLKSTQLILWKRSCDIASKTVGPIVLQSIPRSQAIHEGPYFWKLNLFQQTDFIHAGMKKGNLAEW